MRRSSRYSLRDLAEKAYPWRAIVEVPGEGFGNRINMMMDWLSAEAGGWGKGFEQYPAPRKRGEPDAVIIYFREKATRDRFLADGLPGGLEASPEDRPGLECGGGTA